MGKLRFFPVWVLISSYSLFLPEQSQAANHICTGTLGSTTVENLSVPTGRSCTLKGTRIQGNLLVGSNASLIASEVSISGNLQASNAARVNLSFFSTVNGNIQIQRSQSITISASRINGNVKLTANRGNINAYGNEIQGSLEALQNSGGVSIRNNRIQGNLQCRGNQPSPSGNDNIIGGNRENQCARL